MVRHQHAVVVNGRSLVRAMNAVSTGKRICNSESQSASLKTQQQNDNSPETISRHSNSA